MKTKTKLTKQEEYYVYRYLTAEDYSVETAYKNPSSEKISIENQILYRMKHDFNGFDYRILSHNGFTFSCAFQCETDNGDKFLMVYTPSKWDIFIPLITVDPETAEIKIWSEEFWYHHDRY